jgi:transposase
MRLNLVESKNATQFYVIKSYRENGKNHTKIVEKLGNLDEVKKKAGNQDPYEWAKAYVAELNRIEKEGLEPEVTAKFSPQKQLSQGEQTLFSGGYLFLQKLYHELGLHKICKEISSRYKFEYDLNNILSRLVYGRILFPTSKLGTMEYSRKLIEQPKFQLHQIYRALEVLAKENDFIQSELYKNSLKLAKRNDHILYYDCTNYYFEIEEEDGFRNYGHSKENRPNPIVQMGLFLDGDGIPLAFSITPGNTNEQTTLKPLEQKIIKDFSKANLVVCTDAGLSSNANRRFNNVAGRSFITTQSLKKMKDYQKQWALADDGWKLPGIKTEYKLSEILSDEALFEKYKDKIFYKERWINEDGLEQRFIVSFSIKYMLYHRQLRERQLQRAEKLIERPSKLSKSRQTDPRRFIKETASTTDGEVAEKKSYSIDEDKFIEESRYDGFYAVATNLEDDAESIVRINSRRWEIEESFRIMKSEFDARPVYLSREDRITAHFITCFLALTIYRYLEKKVNSNCTCSEMLETLKGMDFQHLEGQGYIPVYTRTELTDRLHDSFGFRTDYQIVTSKMMKNILKVTQK